MNVMITAKAGDKITERARRALRRRLGGGRMPLEAIQDEVVAKSAGDRGQWFCIDCGELPRNNLEAHSHQEESPKHRLAWRDFTSGKIEEP
jgi:hypothetical protein